MDAHLPDDPDGRVAALFAREVPEIASGKVVIRALARAPGVRTKVAVDTDDPELDPIGVCIGPNGARVARISAELRSESVDVTRWSTYPAEMIRHALAPLRIAGVDLNEAARRAVVTVPGKQHLTALGRRFENWPLASKLSGWDLELVIDPES